LSGSDAQVRSFLRDPGLARLPLLRETPDAFGDADEHTVLVLREQQAYFRINGYTPLEDLGRLSRLFTRM
jgi:hypothetical protein